MLIHVLGRLLPTLARSTFSVLDAWSFRLQSDPREGRHDTSEGFLRGVLTLRVHIFGQICVAALRDLLLILSCTKASPCWHSKMISGIVFSSTSYAVRVPIAATIALLGTWPLQ